MPPCVCTKTLSASSKLCEIEAVTLTKICTGTKEAMPWTLTMRTKRILAPMKNKQTKKPCGAVEVVVEKEG